MIEKTNFFKEYAVGKKFVHRLKQPRSVTLLFTSIIGVFLFFHFYNNAMGRMSLTELGESLQVIRGDTSWLDKKVDTGEVKILPAIQIRVKNRGTRPLGHVNFVGVFSFVEGGKQVGDGNTYDLRKSLDPGQSSKEISIVSKFGYTASKLSAFTENQNEWKPVKVKLFAKTSAGFLELGEYRINQVISGLPGSAAAN